MKVVNLASVNMRVLSVLVNWSNDFFSCSSGVR